MFVRLCEGLDDKGKLVPKNDNIYKYIKDPSKDYYVSVYNYNESQKKQFDEKGTVRGIKNVTTNTLVFDFDAIEVKDAQKDAIETVNRLTQRGIKEDTVNIFYSGGKGFHVVLHTNYEFTPTEAKAIARGVAGDLDSFDSVVYNANRIFRLAYTKHHETGLYKIPLNFDELKSLQIDEIKKLAQEHYEPEKELETTLNDTILSKLYIKKEEPIQEESSLLMDLDLTKRPKNLSPWKYALEQGFFPPKQRSNALIILAATYKSLGYNETKCYYALKAAADLQAQRFNQDKFSKQEIYRNIIGQVYSKEWTGGTFAEDNFPDQLQKYLKELGVPRLDEKDHHENYVVSIGKGFDSFMQYAEQIDENTMKFGIPDLDNALRVQVGHLIGILAPPGIGKTSMALTLLNNTSKDGVKSFFASYDMADKILIQKLVQRETGLNPDEVFDIFRNKNTDEYERIAKLLDKNYANVSLCFKAGQSIDELKESIRQEESVGGEIKLIIVDYLELIRTKSSDPTMASAEAIQGLREIANEGKVVVCLLQPNKMSSTPDEPLLTYNSAKGSSAIAQAVTSMLTMHRPGYNPQDPSEDVYLGINIVKNRMGPLSSVDFSWDGVTGRIGQLEDIQKMDLAELRQRKNAKDEDDL